ncbi:MAG: leucine-rich repeat protein [Verrucomicrobiota bacterium]|nr:leucine-rich repeat protein [Verrucomicrobiota bacterium]
MKSHSTNTFPFARTWPILTLLFLLSTLSALHADTFAGNADVLVGTFGDYVYADDGTSISITGYTGAGGDITLPSEINGKPVTSIGASAFMYKTGLTSMSIPNTVTSIGDWAFSDCTGLTSIIIPNSVTSIGIYAFSNCTGLTSVNISNGVTNIGEGAFSGCTGLTSVSIPSSVASIGDGPFSYCAELTQIEVDSDNSAYASIDGVLFNKTITHLIQYPAAKTGSTYTIPVGVTIIGKRAFYYCTGLTSLSIPNSVTSVGIFAFSNCTGLTNMSLPNSVTSIGDWSFSSCTGLRSIIIPNSVTSIGPFAFYFCTGLTSLIIPNSVTSLGEHAFFECTGLTSMSISNGVTNIGEGAFARCTGLTSVRIPTSVTSIGDGAFSYCTGLTSVNISNGVTNIGEGVFSGCTGLTTVSIPSSVASMGDRPFSYCTELTHIEVDSGNTAYASIDGVLFNKTITHLIQYPAAKAGSIYSIPVGVTSIRDRAFAKCSGLTSIIIPNGVISLGEAALYYCTGLTSINIPNSVTSIGSSAFSYCSGLTSVSIPNSVTSIGEYAFSSCTRLTSVTIPNSVTSILDYTFSSCTRLTSMSIPNSVTSIGRSAFSSCTDLTSVTIPNSVTSIGEWAFSGCTSLTSVSIPYGITIIEGRTFSKCTGLNSVSISNSVTKIGYEAFYGCTGLSSVTIPNSVTTIVYNAFSGCTSLVSAYFDGYAPQSFGTGVFDGTAPNFTLYYRANAIGFTSPTWKNYHAVVNNSAPPLTRTLELSGNLDFGSVQIQQKATRTFTLSNTGDSPLTVTSITYPIGFTPSATGYWVRTTLSAGASMSVSVTFSPTEIKSYDGAIIVNSDRTSGTDTITTLGSGNNELPNLEYKYTDDGTSITITDYTGTGGYLTIPESINGKPVTSIGDSAFYACIGLTSVSIPNSVTSIGNGAFFSCIGLTSVSIPNSVTSIGYSAFSSCTKLTSVSIPNGVNSIGSSAFTGCTRLTSVIISNSVTSIGSYAFSNCTELTTIEVETGNEAYASIDGVLFNNSITLLIHYPKGKAGNIYFIPAGITSIGAEAFAGCSGLTSVSIPNSVTSIGSSAFSYCSGLTSVSIPNSVTSIGSSAFSFCTGLTSVSIPNSVISIESDVFSFCTGLTSMFIPNSVTTIGEWAFFQCIGLTSVTIPKSVTSIKSNAFRGCASLSSAYFEGNAPPTFGTEVFDDTASNFTLYYQSNAFGFTSPTWNGYPTSVYVPITRILDLSGDLDFGSVLVEQTTTRTLTLANTGNAPLTITAITYPAGFSGNWTSGTIAVGASQTVTVTFRPTATQLYSGPITITSDRTSGDDTLSCSGTGISRIINLTGTLAFGDVVYNESATLTFTLSNTGTDTLTVSAIHYPAGFSGDWTNGTIAAGASQTVTVTFSHMAIQSYSGTITVDADQSSGDNTIACSGTGISIPVVTRNISVIGDLDFDDVPINNSQTKPFTITNSGTGTLTVSSITLPTGYSADWVAGTIAPGASQQVNLTFTPSARQNYSGMLVVNSDKTNVAENPLGINKLVCTGSGVPTTFYDAPNTYDMGDDFVWNNLFGFLYTSFHPFAYDFATAQWLYIVGTSESPGYYVFSYNLGHWCYTHPDYYDNRWILDMHTNLWMTGLE